MSTDRGAIPGSTSTITSTTGPAPSRRTRTALRDFYNLAPASVRAAAPAPSASSAATSRASTPPPGSDARPDDDSNAELDAADFSAERHVEKTLRDAGLGEVLRAEALLLKEMRGLDGERKALVYDNYSKLIAATDTIGRMRGEMAREGVGLEGVGEKLEGLVGGIVARAEGVAEKGAFGDGDVKGGERKDQRDTVRWVLGAPARLEDMVKDGRSEDAEREWGEVRGLLDAWEGVDGVEDVRRRCEEAVGSSKGSQ